MCFLPFRFERGQEDTFSLEVDDIAPLKKIRVRTDASGSRPDWFLDKVALTAKASFFCFSRLQGNI